MKFDINFLPAKYGDCIWIEYGDDTLHRVLIDGGTGGTKSRIIEMLDQLPDDEREFELLVVTHVDKDHIEGILSLATSNATFKVKDCWFNGYKHLPGDEDFGGLQGENLSVAIQQRNWPWNEAFNNDAVVLPDDGTLPVIELDGGMKLTLLSPTLQQLAELRPKWDKEIKAAGLVPGFGSQPIAPTDEDEDEDFGLQPDVNVLNDEPFHEDTAEANGSSIAFLASFGGKSVLFAADAYPSTILDGLNQLFDDKAEIDLVKISHHASAHNTSPELIEKIKSKKYVVSTNGSIFKHPAPVTIARVIKRAGSQVRLYFNYRSEENEIWDDEVLRLKHKYKTTYPEDEGIKISLL